MPIRDATVSQERDRGIWYNPFPIDGCPVLVAVDSRGNERKRVVLREGVNPAAAARWLEDVLDRIDPLKPELRLVRPEPDPRRPVDARMEDQLSHALRAFRRNVRSVRRVDE